MKSLTTYLLTNKRLSHHTKYYRENNPFTLVRVQRKSPGDIEYSTGHRINELENGPSSYRLERNFLSQIAWVLMWSEIRFEQNWTIEI